jgi:hypothetical protein
LLTCLIIIGLGCWATFNPSLAGKFYLLYLSLFESFVALQIYFIPRAIRNMQPYDEPFDFSDEEVIVFSKYHFYFRYPNVANNMGVALSNIMFATVPWLLWQLYSRQWLLAALITVTFFPIIPLGRRLQPLLQLQNQVKHLGRDAHTYSWVRVICLP